MPTILKLKKQPQRFAYYEYAAYDLLRSTARALDLRSLLVVLFGAEPGCAAGGRREPVPVGHSLNMQRHRGHAGARPSTPMRAPDQIEPGRSHIDSGKLAIYLTGVYHSLPLGLTATRPLPGIVWKVAVSPVKGSISITLSAAVPA